MARGARRSSRAVNLSLMGGLRLAANGSLLTGRSLGRRAELVLARLALDVGVAVSRDALADAVWGGSLPASWRASLRNAVGEIRRAVTEAGLDSEVTLSATQGGYLLELPAGSTVDVVVLRDEVEEAGRLLVARHNPAALQLAELALGAASAPVLPRAGEDWAEGLRCEVQELRERAAFVGGQAALQSEDAGKAERLARGLVAAAPLREDGHRLLIRALRAAGRRAEALSAYEACRRRLAEELGALPSPATQQLFLEILAEERQEQPAPVRQAAYAPMVGSLLRLAEGTPFVGRVELLSSLQARLRLVGEAGAFVFCLSGEPGSGKTRLAAELVAACRRRGIGALYGRAEGRPGLPYAAFVEALERALSGADRPQLEARLAGHLRVLETLIPSLRAEPSDPAASAPAAPPDGLRRAIVAALGWLAGESGALVVLDDMQWGSRAERQVLEDLLADPESARLLVLVLHRQPGDDGAVPALGQHPRVVRHQLEPLSLQDISALARLIGAGPAPGHEQRARRVWRKSGGNALLAWELLVAPEPGPGASAARPAGVGQLVRDRLTMLPAGAEEVLRLAGVAGTEFSPQLVCAASARGETEVMAVLHAACAAGLLLEATDGGESRLAFRHGLVRDALLEGLDGGELARLHQRLGRQVEAAEQSEAPDLARLAYHFSAAAPVGDPHRALRYALPVSRHAFEAGVFEDVVVVASRALAALAAAGDPEPEARLELEVLLGGAQRALGDPAGEERLTAVFAAAAARGDAARMADAALAVSPVAGALSEGLYLDDRELARYEQVVAALDGSQAARRARLLARMASGQAWRRSQRDSWPVAEQAVALARRVGDDQTLANVLAAVRLSLAGSADLGRVQRLEDELAELAEHLGDPALGVSVALWRFASSVQRGTGQVLEGLLSQAAVSARGVRSGNLHHSLAYEQASLALLRGRTGEAETLMARAAQVGRERGVDVSVVESIRLTQMMLLRGEQRRLGGLRAEAAALFETAGITHWRAAMAAIDAARGELAGVGERIDAVLADYERNGPTVLSPGGAIAYFASTVVALGDRARARRVVELVRPLSGQGVYLAGFAGPVDYHLGLMERLLGDEPAARDLFAAAEEFCRRLGAPRWQARCRAAQDAAAAG